MSPSNAEGSAQEVSLEGVGGPPHLGDGISEDLATIALNLAREVWILRDRIVLLEKHLARAGILEEGTLDQQWPDTATSDQLEADRESFITNLFRFTSLGS